MFLIWFFGILIGYPTIGFVIATYLRPKLIALSRFYEGDEYTRIKPGYNYITETVQHFSDGFDREKVNSNTKSLIYGWPVLTWLLVMETRNQKAIDRVDPVVYERLVKRNAELERELGMS